MVIMQNLKSTWYMAPCGACMHAARRGEFNYCACALAGPRYSIDRPAAIALPRKYPDPARIRSSRRPEWYYTDGLYSTKIPRKEREGKENGQDGAEVTTDSDIATRSRMRSSTRTRVRRN